MDCMVQRRLTLKALDTIDYFSATYAASRKKEMSLGKISFELPLSSNYFIFVPSSIT